MSWVDEDKLLKCLRNNVGEIAIPDGGIVDTFEEAAEHIEQLRAALEEIFKSIENRNRSDLEIVNDVVSWKNKWKDIFK